MSRYASAQTSRSGYRRDVLGPVPGAAFAPQTTPLGIGPASSLSPLRSIARRDDPAAGKCLTATGSTGQKFLTERDLSRKVSEVARHFQRGELAQAAGSSKEAAKNWQDGTSCPNTAKTINLARKIPAVAELVLSEIVGDENGPDALNAVMAGLHMVAADPGAQGSAARALLYRLMGRP